jgi:hypothetical protein
LKRTQIFRAAQLKRIWWQEGLRAARRVFNDPEQVEKVVEILEAAASS